MVQSRRTILFADDDEGVRNSFGRYLRKFFNDYNLEILHEGNSLEGRLTADVSDVALVVLDHNMPPGKTGGEIVKQYARRLKDIPFILYYAGGVEIGEEARQDGAFAHVSKLEETKTLLEIMGDALAYFNTESHLSMPSSR